MDSFASALAGFAFFLIGIHSFSDNINILTTLKVRNFIAKYNSNNIMSGIWGFIISIITIGNTFLAPCIAAGLASIKTITMRRSYIMVIWGRLGATIFVYLIGLNIHTTILFLLGLSGISFVLKKPRSLHKIMTLLFNVCMILFGIHMIKNNLIFLVDMDWFNTLMAYAKNYPSISFLTGFALIMMLQSLISSIILIMTILDTGLISNQYAIFILLGAYLGQGILKMVYLTSFEKEFKKNILLISIFYISASLVGLLINLFFNSFFSETLSIYFKDPNLYFAVLNFSFHLINIIVISLFLSRIERFIEMAIPTAKEMGRLIPKVSIPEIILDSSASALMLIEKQRMEQIDQLPILINNIRIRNGINIQNSRQLHQELSENLIILKDSINSLVNRQNHSENTISTLLHNMEFQSLIIDLEENIHRIGSTILSMETESPQEEQLKQYLDNFIEATDVLILSLIDYLKNPSETFYKETLKKLSRGRPKLMLQIRKEYIHKTSKNIQFDFIKLTNLFESMIWIVNKISYIEVNFLEEHPIKNAVRDIFKKLNPLAK